jgi:hypothetical protein
VPRQPPAGASAPAASPGLGRAPCRARTGSLLIEGQVSWSASSYGACDRAHYGWPPRSRTARYLLIRQAPSTSWVVAIGCCRSRNPARRVRLAGFQGRFRRQSDCASVSGESGARTHKALARSAVFWTAAVVRHQACLAAADGVQRGIAVRLRAISPWVPSLGLEPRPTRSERAGSTNWPRRACSLEPRQPRSRRGGLPLAALPRRGYQGWSRTSVLLSQGQGGHSQTCSRRVIGRCLAVRPVRRRASVPNRPGT